MKVFNSIDSFYSSKKTIMTIGTFDGVHIGHQSILKKITSIDTQKELTSVVLTFFPHPRMVLNQENSIKLLNTIEEKILLLKRFKVENLIIHPFDKTFSDLSPEKFVTEVLIKKLNIQKIIIGYDHRFGKNRAANIDDLIIFGKKYGFEVEQLSAEEIDEIAISSTKIRKAITDGNIKLANDYLGYPFMLTGKVIHGKKIGRTIGFPTANIEITENYKLLPKNGVYVVSSIMNNMEYYGMMNIGKNPTIGENEQSVEVHFLDINEDLYGKELQISILEHIRDEKKFNSLSELQEQLAKDRIFSLNFIKKQQ
ncbi:bifunctional riboflavin kinase/FAD synthetase [Flavobacterium sp. HXWNR69]|uniref:Riboflavin biosynthesis protein n=1 Tax=Flavobacterium fragile TaxID=2949085 RepID=A0ABT0TEB9_9FLAO|nr:bifunctional riboflavin kinase/FAD synthetase [Flavobacterium sp. HXWNR69]MCL9769312.1 bifunctional riboflavin kinase/FAD synthetase [Flavobacterium sp. HXWNR69]